MAISPVRLSVTTKIPAKSSGRLIDALTDLIRPITERQGLKADLIRLQREEVAYQVAELAARRIALEKRKIIPVPLKAIIPLLERASLEEPGDTTMISMWANLLASAAMGEQRNVPRYVSILSDINGRQARLVQEIILKGHEGDATLDAELLLDDLWSIDREGVLLRLKQELTRATVKRIVETIKAHVDTFGVALGDIILNKGEQQWDTRDGLFPLDEHRIDLETLEGLNLLKDATFKDAAFKGFEISVFFYRVTPLCVDMFSACNPHLFVARGARTPETSGDG